MDSADERAFIESEAEAVTADVLALALREPHLTRLLAAMAAASQEAAQRHQELLDALTDLHRPATNGDHAAMRSLTVAQDAAVAKQAYAETVKAVLSALRREVLPGSTIAIVNKGDPQLLAVDGSIGWHFPRQPDGRYTGFHPSDSDAAIRHVEDARAAGAHYLLFPPSARWWLDHYTGLRNHLDRKYRVGADRPELGVLYMLATRASVTGGEPSGNDDESDTRLIDELREIVCNLFDADADVVVVSKGDDRLLDLGTCMASHFPQDQDRNYTWHYPSDDAHAIECLELARANGAMFIVFPATAFWWFEHYSQFARDLATQFAALLVQSHVCVIFDLRMRSPLSLSQHHEPKRDR